MNMKSTNYKISQYLIYKINEEEAVVQSQTTTTVINNEKMQQLLFLFENEDYITDTQIEEIFESNTEPAIKFLLNEGLILRSPYRNFDIENIVFVATGHWNPKLFPNKIEGMDVKHASIDRLNIFLNKNTIIVSYLNPYHVGMVDEIQRQINESQYSETIYQLNIFSYGMSMYVDNLYNKSWEVPTHRDHLGIIRTEQKSEENNISYVDLMNHIYDRDPLFNIERPIDEDEQIFIINFLLTRLHSIVSLKSSDMLREYELLRMYELNLNERRVLKDTATFWELSEDE